MKISYNWLKTYININHTAQQIAEILTDTGLEVENVEQIETVKGGLEGVVIGHVLTKTPHPDADRLNITTVNIGAEENLQIVCGAPNVEAGQKVLVATVGTTLYPGGEGETLKIKKSKIRGVESAGMICAEDELGLGESHDGIMILDPNAEIGMPARTYFNIEDDYLFEIGLTPNRADAMGHIGVARDLKAYLNFHQKAGLSLTIPTLAQLEESGETIEIKLHNSEACPRYAGAVITGVSVQESPDWLQNRLRSIGLKPLNNIVDITNFVLHETGTPLHAFDLKQVDGHIEVRRAKKGEKLLTLDEIERNLDEQDLMICNANEAMCLAGVFGGLHSGVKAETKGIFLEVAYFDPVSIRKSAKRQGLNTDASFRFERGIDPNAVLQARNRAVSLILEIAGGKLGSLHDLYPQPISDFEVVFSFDRCRKICGINIPDETILNLLEELDIRPISDSEENVVLKVPAYRVDVKREIDVIEEVLRIYGFNNVPFPEKMSTSLTYQAKPDREKLYNTAANLLVDNGFSEIMNNSLTSSTNWAKLNSTHHNNTNDVVVLNPLSNELDVMRQTLLIGGLKSIEYNQNRQNPDLKLFEFGTTYQKVEGAYRETKKLDLWMCGLNEKENWTTNGQKVSFYALKGAVEGLLTRLGIFKAPRISPLENDIFEDGYQITIAQKTVVELGWIKPQILRAFGVKNTVYYASFNWDMVIELAVMNTINFKAIPKTQFARRDFSLLLDKSVTFAEIQALAQKADRKILREVGLFDVYEGKNLDKNKKSYAVSFIFQDDEKTLKDNQIDAIMQKIRQNLEGQLGAELR